MTLPNTKEDTLKKLKRFKKAGGARRKQNAKRTRKEMKQEKAKKDFIAVLQKINNCIEESYINSNTDDLINYLNQSLLIIYAQLRPQELNRKSKEIKNIKKLRENWYDIKSLIIKKVDDTSLQNQYVFRESFTFYTKNFSKYGLQYITSCYSQLYDSLLSKVYAEVHTSNDQKPDDRELELGQTRLDLADVKLNDITKEQLHRKYLEKTLEYHMDTPNAMREKEKYTILRKRIRKALISLELYLDYFNLSDS